MFVLKVIGATFIFAIIVVLVLAFQKPDEFRVTRSASFDAPIDQVFLQVNNFKLGQAWSPWVDMEPDAEFKFEGPDAGVGATIYWEGNETGKGKMSIIETRENEFVRSRLEFYKPMEAVNNAEFLLEPEGSGTKLTWTMYGPNHFIGKLMSVFMDCEKIIGGQFEKGLSNLKSIVEQNNPS